MDRDESLAAVEETTRRWVELLLTVEDKSRHAVGDWNIRDVAVHTSHVYSALTQLIAGGESPIKDHRAIAQTWARKAAEDPEQDLAAAAARIEESMKDFINLADSDSWTRETPWHGGIRIPFYSFSSFLISEASIHGHDVAKAEGRPWVINRRHAALIVEGHWPVLPHFVNDDVARTIDATFEVKVRSGSNVFVTVRNGTLELGEQPPGRVDCTLSVDPVEYLLVGYGRKSQWGPIAMGKLVAYGRKPWLSLKMSKLFNSP